MSDVTIKTLACTWIVLPFLPLRTMHVHKKGLFILFYSVKFLLFIYF